MRNIVGKLHERRIGLGRSILRSAKLLAIASSVVVTLGSFLPAVDMGTARAASDRPVLTIAMPTLWAAHRPVANSNFDVRVTYSIYDGLVRRDWLSAPGGGGSKIVPALATSWEQVSPTVWDFTIRKGVKFHDGTDMTVEDVVFSLSNTFGPDATEIFPLGAGLKSVTAIDDSTVRVTTKKPDAALLARMATPLSHVVPKEYYLRVGEVPFGRDPIGTGPYKWAGRISGESLTLEAFDDYWGDRPPLNSIIYREVPEVSSRIAGLLTGEYDIVTSLPPNLTKPIDDDDATEIRGGMVENVHILSFRQWKADSPISDKRVRKAMVLSLNRELLAEKLWTGLSVAGNYDFSGFGDYYGNRKPMPYDPEGAKKLLQEAGYNGEPITIRIVSGYYTNLERALAAGLEMWKEVGLNVKIEPIENWGQMGSENDMYSVSTNMEMADPAGGMWASWGREGGHRMKDWTEGAPPAEFVALGVKLETSSDFDVRKKAYNDLLDMFDDLVPAILLYRSVEVYGVRKNLKWQPYSHYYMDFRAFNIGLDG